MMTGSEAAKEKVSGACQWRVAPPPRRIRRTAATVMSSGTIVHTMSADSA